MMLRPISQLNSSPSIAMPMLILKMVSLVCSCEAATPSAAAVAWRWLRRDEDLVGGRKTKPVLADMIASRAIFSLEAIQSSNALMVFTRSPRAFAS